MESPCGVVDRGCVAVGGAAVLSDRVAVGGAECLAELSGGLGVESASLVSLLEIMTWSSIT